MRKLRDVYPKVKGKMYERKGNVTYFMLSDIKLSHSDFFVILKFTISGVSCYFLASPDKRNHHACFSSIVKRVLLYSGSHYSFFKKRNHGNLFVFVAAPEYGGISTIFRNRIFFSCLYCNFEKIYSISKYKQ